MVGPHTYPAAQVMSDTRTRGQEHEVDVGRFTTVIGRARYRRAVRAVWSATPTEKLRPTLILPKVLTKVL